MTKAILLYIGLSIITVAWGAMVLPMSTALKIRVARVLVSFLLLIGVKPCRVVKRKGITYDLDIREAIDLSIFLQGGFQKHILGLVEKRNAIVIDVGANVGAITLPLAKYLTQGHVYAIEPTDFALEKLRRNVALNPELAKRITIVQSFVADTARESSDLIAYSSWRLDGTGTHPVHGGTVKPTSCGQITLDDFVKCGIKPDLIKIDTDGHEYKVLQGARECMKLKPVIVFEACEYLMQPPNPTIEDFIALFESRGYTVCLGNHGIDARAFRTACPNGGGLDLVAVPS